VSLKNKAISGVKWTTLSSIIIAATQLLQLSIFARYLSSQEFGLIAILNVVMALSLTFVDFGISKAIVYKRDVSETQLSTLYWLNIIFGVVVFGIISFLSNHIANFYHENSLAILIKYIAFALFIQAFGLQFRTLFQKEMQFNILAKIDIVAAIVSFIVSMILITHDFKIYSFIYSILMISLIRSLLLVYFGKEIHKPKFIFKLKQVKEYISFGLYTVGNGIVSTIATQIDVILIGKLLGVETLGLYNVIKELILRPAQLINPIVTKVAFPTMSKVNHDVKYMNNIYLKMRNYVASVTFPVYTLSFILAPEIITIFLGKQWLEGAHIFQILSIWALLRSVGSLIGSLVMAAGKPEYEMHWNIGMMIYMPLMVMVSYRWGIEGIAYGNLLSIVLLFVPGWYFLAYRLTRIQLRDYIRSILNPILISIVVGSIIYFLIELFSISGIIEKISLSALASILLLWILNKKYNRDFYITVLSFIKGIT